MQPDAAWPASPAAVAVTRGWPTSASVRGDDSGTNELVCIRDDGGGIYVR